MGKTVTSYPPARGENSLESIKGAQLPQRFIFGLCAGKMKLGRGRRSRLQPRAETSHASHQQRGCGSASSVPTSPHTLKGVSTGRVNWLAGQLTSVWCDDKKQTGKGRGRGMATSQALPRIPCVILGEPFPALRLDPRTPLLSV